MLLLVSVPYEITLLSNQLMKLITTVKVSVPYEITLLSNLKQWFIDLGDVSVPYEITLLSNTLLGGHVEASFQYLMKLHYSQTPLGALFIQKKFQYLMKLHYSQTSNKLRHYNAQGNNIRYFYYTI